MRGTTGRQQARWSSIIAGLIGIFLLGILTVSAQDTGTPINVGENKTGDIAEPAGSTAYSLAIGTPQSVNVLVLAITPGYAPAFRVLDPSGVVVVDNANADTKTNAQGQVALSGVGTYTIEVRSANGTAGQFVVSVQPGAPLAPPVPLTPGVPINGIVDSQTTRQAYSFSGLPSDGLLLTVYGDGLASGPVVTIRDADTSETLGVSSARFSGIDYRIPASPSHYLVEVLHSGSATAEGFVVCLATASGSATCSGAPIAAATTIPLVPTQIVLAPTEPPATFAPVSIDPNGACEVASAGGQTINVRSGPGTSNGVITHLSPSISVPVIGRVPDNSWFQVNVGGVIGWVSASVVTVGGNCSGVSVVQLPTAVPPTNAPTAAPTNPNAPTSEPTTAPTDAPTTEPTTAPTVDPNQPTATHHPIFVSSLVAGHLGDIQVQPINPKLDYEASGNYGEANLSVGFSPDPYSVGMTTGGNVNVSYLGGSCSGFATAHPDLRINFGGGGASLLRIYFVGANGDATMVVNDPYGNFYCVDDSFGTVNPTIDFNNPAGGSYDVWIGSYAANTTISGTLYLTENSGNHP